MKYFIGLFICLCSLSYAAFSQIAKTEAPSLPIDNDTKLITYKSVVNELGNKDELYERGLLWFSKFYKNPTDVIREKDKENGKIKGIARFQLHAEDKDTKVPKGAIEYTLNLEFKDKRYRYTITNFNLKQSSYFPLERWLNKKDPASTENINLYLIQIDTYINELTKNLEKGMNPVEKKKDDW